LNFSNTIDQCIIATSFGLLYLKDRRFSTNFTITANDKKGALDYLQKALKISLDYGEKLSEVIIWIWLGKVLEIKERLQIDKAEKSMLKGIEILV
jgi:hypothetical protein